MTPTVRPQPANGTARANAPATGSSAAGSSALEVRNLDCGYGQTAVLRDVTLTVPAGSVVALLGPNGAGKTTLLRAVAGHIRPTAGTVLLGGRDVTSTSPHLRAQAGLVHIPQGRGVFKSLTVAENLTLQATGRPAEAIERAAAAFPVLKDRLRQVAGSMSGGQQQMLALAAAYVRNPVVIAVDEASLGLAPVTVDVVFDFLGRVAREGTSILLVDQFVDRALSLAATAYLLRKGHITFTGTAAELAATDIFAEYVGTTASHAEDRGE